jgi:uncharacterized RDD family membrane protein YckC
LATSSRRRFKAHNHPNASLIKRLMAIIYDSLLIVAVWMLVGFIAVALNNGEAVQGPWFNSLILVVTYGFFALFWCRSGQTLGMIAWRLRVEDNDGYVLNLKQALARFLGAIVSAACFGLGYLWMLAGKQPLSWHDRWSKTRIVQLPKRDVVEP